MKAIYFDGKDPSLVTDYPEPQNEEVKIRVTKAGICGTDLEIFKGYMNFVGVPGHEFVGIVTEAKNKKLVGKKIVGEINVGCGACNECRTGTERHCPNRTVLGIYKRDGAFAEYITLPERNIHAIPHSLRDEEAVFVEPLAAAFEILEQVRISPKWKVAVIGDGKLAQLISQVMALSNKTITCFGKHQRKLEIISRLGIETTIGNLEENQHRFDLVIEATGRESGFRDAMKIVKPRGKIILKSTTHSQGKIDLTQAIINEIQIIGSRCGPFNPAITALVTGKINVRDLIDKTYPIEDYKMALQQASEPDSLKVTIDP